MTTLEQIQEMALKAGLTHSSPLDVSTIVLKDEVRAMCEANRCGAYGHSWSCPPGCGELDVLRTIVAGYHTGLLVQTVGQLEDEFDGEGMMATEEAHRRHFEVLRRQLTEFWPNLLALGAGACRRCARCTFPDAPCRFPGEKISSMESYGILVTEVCLANGMKYYYGPGTIAFTGCFLLE